MDGEAARFVAGNHHNEGEKMQAAVMTLIGAVMIIGGVVAIVWSRRTADKRGRDETYFVLAWSSVAVWFGALPVIGAIDEVAGLPAKLLDTLYALVLIGGLAVTLLFVTAGIRSRRREFRTLQRQCVDEGRTPSRYFWRPWAIFSWTLGLGAMLVLGGGIGVASLVGALLDNATADEVDRTAQSIANVLTVCTFALLPLAAAAGLWRWVQLRIEERQLAAVSDEQKPRREAAVGANETASSQ
ncbi:hypothetical protein [Prescottella equi]|uniref:hypothetical protein n=1 Tax=Rhodococcus hoagii TaxID=43767 RepID=UPI00384B866E